MKGRAAHFILLMALACVTLMGTTVLLGVSYYNTPGPLTEKTTLIIERGTGLKETVRLLFHEQVIDHPSVFMMVTMATGQSHKIKAGEYRFEPGMSFHDILVKLTGGHTVIRRVTIPEGLTTLQILDILEQTKGLRGKVTRVIEQGDLLPETYHFSYGDRREDIVNRMRQSMKVTLAELWEKRQKDLPFDTPQQAVILASIVEKETGVKQERARVAGVFINRLNKKMPLQSDPTVIFAITRGKKTLDRPLKRSDLKISSPFNTYYTQGLPPEPISHPGKASIQAVLNPMKTRDLYFVADGKGGHNFAETLQQHNRNVTLFRNRVKKVLTVKQ